MTMLLAHLKHAALVLAASLCLILGMGHSSLASTGDLAAQFTTPPASAKPWVYWFWSEGNITREGITADLEAMQRVGIGGVLIMEVAQEIPKGPVQFGSPQWRDLFHHAIAEAARLGLQVNMNNDAGWSGSGGPWIKPELAMQNLVSTQTEVGGPKQFQETLPQPQAVAGYYKDIAVVAFPTPSGKGDPKKQFDRQRVVDLTAHFGKDGRLSWDVPPGKWTILRLGHTPTGATNVPAPMEGRGLECDKLSKDAIDAQFAGLMAKLIADVGPAVGKTLVSTHIDSWEVHGQTWTPRLREAFQQRRGYDPLPLLPALTGRADQNPDISARFLWDMRKTIAELLCDNYAGRLAELAHRHGMSLSIEAYGDFPFDELTYAGRADSPMGEFWVGTWGGMNTVRSMASAAHVYGKNIIGAEAFTAMAADAKWANHPFTLKAMGDTAFCNGVNRFVFHRYAHQPWLDRRPGMTMGPWGVHYERTETWWEQTRPWHAYLSRCQHLLRQGVYVADLCYLQLEDPTRGSYGLGHAPPSPYEFDACPAEAVMTRMSVRDGRLVLPDGMSYRILVLPPSDAMSPELLAKIKELVEAGATVVGPRPIRSPSLVGYPDCDARVKGLAAELWADADGKTVTEHRLGKGRVILGKTPEAVLAEMAVSPDFRSSLGSPPHYLSLAPSIRYIHRSVDGTEIYFIANSFPHAVDSQCTFRVKGRQPELWHPDTGQIEPVVLYDETADGTRMPISLDPSGSVFVVFRSDAKPANDRVVAIRRDGQFVVGAETSTAKLTIGKATYGVPGEPARTRDVTTRVQQFADRHDYAFQVARMAEGDDPAPGVVKMLNVEYAIDGEPHSAYATDPEIIHFFAEKLRDAAVRCGKDGRLRLESEKPGRYEVKLASGKTQTVEIPALPQPMEVAGPWRVDFLPGCGASKSVQFDKLVSWPDHPDASVKYFSGTAVYRTTFDVSADLIAANRRPLRLDLGRVQVIAEVKLNGRELGILWKPPFCIDVADALKAGENTLEVRVTNLWVNRLIGDEQLPDDCQWGPPYQWGGQPLAQWPQWLLDGKPSPTGRCTFTTWRHWNKNSPLLESGLLGPVRLVATATVPLP
jgi:hypothetical protein